MVVDPRKRVEPLHLVMWGLIVLAGAGFLWWYLTSH